jgi:hypothetical protein
MRLMLVLVSILAAAPAYAGGAVPPLDATKLPCACRWTADVPVGAPPRQHYAAVISAANCQAMRELSATKDHDAMWSALQPSIALLDSVIHNGDTEAQIVAQYAKADLLSGIRVRLVSLIPRVGTMKGRDLVKYIGNVERANALADACGDRAAAAFREVHRLANTPEGHAAAEQNPTVAYAVRDARTGGAVISQR